MLVVWSKKSDKFKPIIFLDKISKSASLNSEGRVQYDGFSFYENKGMLRSMVEFIGTESISPDSEDKIFDSSLNLFVRKSKEIKTNQLNEFIACANHELKKYLKKEKQIFYVVSSLSLSENIPITRFKFPQTDIRFYKSGPPKKFRSRDQYDERWIFAKPHTPSNYSSIVAKVLARTPNDAISIAIDDLDYIRGILSFFANPGMSMSFNLNKRKSINKIRLGGLHSVHDSTGEIASQQFWYESDYEPHPPFIFPSENIKLIRMKIRKIIKRIEQMKGGAKLRDGIIRYVRALDEHNKDHVIIKLWGALEATAGEGDKSELIIRRCSYIFKEQELVKQILEVAKIYRNRNVHGDFSSNTADLLVYKLQTIFTHLILFYIGSKDLVSLTEANSFLDSPLAAGDLERKIFLLKKAVKFRSGT